MCADHQTHVIAHWNSCRVAFKETTPYLRYCALSNYGSQRKLPTCPSCMLCFSAVHSAATASLDPRISIECGVNHQHLPIEGTLYRRTSLSLHCSAADAQSSKASAMINLHLSIAAFHWVSVHVLWNGTQPVRK